MTRKNTSGLARRRPTRRLGPFRGCPWRQNLTLLLVWIMALGPTAFIRPGVARAQAPALDPGANQSELPLADPVLTTPAEFKARKTTSWVQGVSRLMLLEGDFSFTMGTYGFRADRAVVRIDQEQQPGRLIRHLSIYLDNARPLFGRGPVQAEAPRLLVTASTTGKIELATDLLQDKPATGDALVAQAQGRINQYLASISQPLLRVPSGIPVFTPEMEARREQRHEEIAQEVRSRATEALVAKAPGPPPARPIAAPPATTAVQTQPAPMPQGRLTVEPGRPAAAGRAPALAAVKPAVPEQARILPAGGVVSFNADRIVFEPSAKGEGTLVLMGHVRVLYQSFEHKPGASLTAENAVIFVAGEKLADLSSGKMKANDVRGIYLEDNVVTTYDQYTVRAPRVFYDLTRNKAVVLDAVMYTWDIKREIPLYVRAEKLRQESADTWTAARATVTTSEFAVPHFAIAARQVTIHQETQPDGAALTRFVARDTTARVGGLPVFYWPSFSGQTGSEIPIKRTDVGFSKHNGPFVKTTWDLLSLSSQPKPEGVELDGHLDYLGDHGPAAGINLDYDRPMMFGKLDTYLVGYDQGEDRIGGRTPIEFDGDTRGFALWRHRQYFQDNWELSIEAAYVSDETFLEEFFRRQAEESKPYETSAYVKKQQEDWAFTFLTRYEINNFVPQTTTLQAPGYTVDKLPELGYYRVATSLWGDRLTYFTENRASRLRIRTGQDRPEDRGFTEAQSQLLFGIPRTVSFEDDFEAQGIPTDYRNRLDTRHEIDAPTKLAIFDVTPYVAGRFTGYDDDFKEFSGETDQTRVWGTAGMRLSTQFNRTYDDVESQLWNLHRLRHIIEPNADIFLAASSLDSQKLPVFDPDVEGIQDGNGARLGLRNTLQTQRGGLGRWRDVDWLVINTDVIFRSDEPVEGNTAIARFIDYRPEYSLGGDHFHSDVAWQVSDTLAMVGDFVQNLETGDTAQWRVGANLQHTPYLTSFIDYTEIDILSSRLLSFGFNYQITRKYTLGVRQTIDLGRNQARSLDITLTRKLPRWQLVVVAKFDEVDDEQTFGVVLVPEGISVNRLADPFGTLHPRD